MLLPEVGQERPERVFRDPDVGDVSGLTADPVSSGPPVARSYVQAISVKSGMTARAGSS